MERGGDIFIASLTSSPWRLQRRLSHLHPNVIFTLKTFKGYIQSCGHLLRVCWEVPFWKETGSIFAILRHFSNYRMMSSTCVSLTWRLTTNKHGGPPAGILLSAIYKPFITLVCLLSSLFPYHWWQYLLLIVNLNEMQEKTYLKVVLLGKVNSGKTCLVTRYITRSFSEETPSVSTFFFSTIFIFFNFSLLYV